MTINIVNYEAINKNEWNDFVSTAKNGHFMFYREYMDYHADRFIDHSLMFYDEQGRLVAVLPANIKERVLYSHQGLTFGGLIINNKAITEKVYEIFVTMCDSLKTMGGIDSIVYKRMPDLYSIYPSQEDLYALFLLNAKLLRRDVSVAISLLTPYDYQDMRKRKVKKAKRHGLEVFEELNFKDYWLLLTEVLNNKHNTAPLHSLEEINLLQSNFPDNIKCYCARLNGEILAGTVIYETDTVAHTQYLANSDRGRDFSALDLVIDHLIKNIYTDKKYLNFGISTENNGRTLNKGLIAQKEGFGARAIVHDFYEIKII